jgi:DNA helicase-2/ATP-dependent DNA helicase PcrA
MLESIDGFRERLMDPEEASIKAGESTDDVLIAHAELYTLYDQHLTDHKLIDYARMIQFAVKAFKVDAEGSQNYIRQFTHILVDEFQDINFAQKVMIDELLKGGANLWVVGDDDQAIYGWRGSSVKYILRFSDYYPRAGVVNLKQNYRSAPELVAASNALAAHFVERRDKELISESGKSGEIYINKFYDEYSEVKQIAKSLKSLHASGIPYSEMAILARTNALPSALVDNLLVHNIPVTLSNGVEAFQNDQTRELIAAAAIASSQKVTRSWNRKIGSKLFSFAKKLETEDVWERKVKALATSILRALPATIEEEVKVEITEKVEHCREFLCSFDEADEAFGRLEASTKKQDDAIHVGTIHGAKGLEWEAVFVIGCEEGLLPHSLAEELAQIEEERRLFYVAITRAKTHLDLSYLERRNEKERFASPYLSEIQSKAKLASKKISDKDFSNLLEKMRRYGEEYGQLKKDNPTPISTQIADGYGEGTGWQINDTGKGFLAEIGYTARQNGPDASERQETLADVFHGRITMPDSIRESVAEKWGEPETTERLRKIRNTINVALGTQKARSNPSEQAIEKWEEDLSYIDTQLAPQLGGLD